MDRREYRAYINVRPKGGHPADIAEIRSEHYDSYEAYAEAIRVMVLETIMTDMDQEGTNEADKLTRI